MGLLCERGSNRIILVDAIIFNTSEIFFYTGGIIFNR
jgi:hypothetical protein